MDFRYIIIGINVLVFILQQFFPGIDYMYSNNVLAILGGEYWRLLTAGFLHGSLPHLFGNMWMLNITGKMIEKRYGGHKFLLMYLLSIIAGSVFSFLYNYMNKAFYVIALGASGGVFGLVGGIAGFYWVNRDDVFLKKTLGSWLAEIIVINVGFAFIDPNIDWMAHVGGFIMGYIVARIFEKKKRSDFVY